MGTHEKRRHADQVRDDDPGNWVRRAETGHDLPLTLNGITEVGSQYAIVITGSRSAIVQRLLKTLGELDQEPTSLRLFLGSSDPDQLAQEEVVGELRDMGAVVNPIRIAYGQSDEGDPVPAELLKLPKTRPWLLIHAAAGGHDGLNRQIIRQLVKKYRDKGKQPLPFSDDLKEIQQLLDEGLTDKEVIQYLKMANWIGPYNLTNSLLEKNLLPKDSIVMEMPSFPAYFYGDTRTANQLPQIYQLVAWSKHNFSKKLADLVDLWNAGRPYQQVILLSALVETVRGTTMGDMLAGEQGLRRYFEPNVRETSFQPDQLPTVDDVVIGLLRAARYAPQLPSVPGRRDHQHKRVVISGRGPGGFATRLTPEIIIRYRQQLAAAPEGLMVPNVARQFE